MNDLLRQLQEDVNFQAIMSDVLKHRPVVPDYTPQATRDETENLMERIKYHSANRAGFDMLYRILTGRAP